MLMTGVWQDMGSLSSGNSRLLMIFVGLVALCMVAQTVLFLVAVVGMAKARKRFLTMAEDVKEKTLPLLEKTHGMVSDLQPKIQTITDNVLDTSHVVRARTNEFGATMSEVNERVRSQAARVDNMVTSVLDTTSEVASVAQKAARVPVREFSGLMAGLKAALSVMMGPAKHSGNDHRQTATSDEDESISY